MKELKYENEQLKAKIEALERNTEEEQKLTLENLK